MTETFAQRLRRLRDDHGFTGGQLANEVNVSEGAIRQLESGAVRSPSFSLGLRLAHRLGVDPYELAFGEGSTLQDRLTVLERRLAALEQPRR